MPSRSAPVEFPRTELEDELVRLLGAANGHYEIDVLAGRPWNCQCEDCAITRAVWRVGGLQQMRSIGEA